MNKKTILITGAGSGIGRETSLVLAKKGHKVIATTHTEEQANEFKFFCEKEKLPVEIFKLDIKVAKDREKILNFDLDVLVNNAAIGESGSLAEIPVERIRDNFEVNVFSTIEISQLAFKKMIPVNRGRVIFIGSLGGRVSMPFLAPYSMTKFALAGGIDALRQELKKITKKVFVTLIEPGSYHTGFNQKNLAKKYEWMDEGSFFYPILNKIKKEEELAFKVLEHKSLKSIVKKIVEACEAEKPNYRYTAPFWQAAGVHLLRIFGK